MNGAQALRNLLAPMGVYRLDGTVNGGELEAVGAALDQVSAGLDELEREALLATAEDWGLDRLEELLARRPVASTVQDRRAALAALLRIGGDSFTLQAINDNLRGCGLNAVAEETGTPGYVTVRFPQVPGIPNGFDEMRSIIEEILPCHLDITYLYWYLTWGEMETRFPHWSDLDALETTWEELEKMVSEQREEGTE